MGITIGQWLSMTKENPADEDKRWFGIEIEESQANNLKGRLLNKLNKTALLVESSVMKGMVHFDIYVNKYEIDKIQEIIDKHFVKKSKDNDGDKE